MAVTTAIVNGAIGGVLATAVMTVAMRALQDESLLPTAIFWSQFVGGEPEDNTAPAMGLHFLYGTTVAAVLGLILTVSGIEVGAVVNFGTGVAYGVLLFIVGALFWMRTVLGVTQEQREMMVFLLLHFVYGGVLGVWLAAGVL